MSIDNWHSEFNPSSFLGRIDFARLVQRNEAYNESLVHDSDSPCMLCENHNLRGILLNNKLFLCEKCYSEVSLISYPEKYEVLRRQYVVATEARRIAWESFRARYECKFDSSPLVPIGWVLALIALAYPVFLIIPGILLTIGYYKDHVGNERLEEWENRKIKWEQINVNPKEPELRHFHDQAAELTQRDYRILDIFNHWPGYPPFWKYLRAVVLNRDSNRCQVTGCPSRLELHVHHMIAVSNGGTHSPDNLISLCDFHHALEPEKGHERIWGEIKTRYFTLVRAHERASRTRDDTHFVRAHLRRLHLVTLEDLYELMRVYGFCCPTCGEVDIQFNISYVKNVVRVECPSCGSAAEGPQQLAEETGPFLAELLGVSRNIGRWKARWDMLSERKEATWGLWKGPSASIKRKRYQDRIQISKAAPQCPLCGSPMRLIRPRQTDTWKAFWGCAQYPINGCRGSVRFTSDDC